MTSGVESGSAGVIICGGEGSCVGRWRGHVWRGDGGEGSLWGGEGSLWGVKGHVWKVKGHVWEVKGHVWGSEGSCVER